MREIEVKAKLKDINDFLSHAKKQGIEFNDVVVQVDRTYETRIPYDSPNWNIFRLRKQADKLILTMKHKASSRSRDNYEYETVVEDEGEIIKILERLGYTFGVEVRKQRRTAKYNDMELCLDEIDRLGNFVEVEKLVDGVADIDKIRGELWDLLTQLGVNPKDRVHKGYDILMHEMNSRN
jgi:adenylate cyclase, class 2